MSGATKYEIWQRVGTSGSYTQIATVTGTSYTDTSAVGGKTYYYKIRALGSVSAATSAFSSEISKACDYARPTLSVTNVASTGKPKLTWAKVANAPKYEIWQRVGTSGSYTKIATVTGTSYTDTSAVAGKTYYYKICAAGSYAAATSAFSSEISKACDFAKPSLSVTNVASTGKPKLSWAKVTGATKYEIWQRVGTSGTYAKIATVTGTSYTDTSAVGGKAYYYKIRAASSYEAATSAFSSEISKACDYARPTLSVTNVASSGKPKLTWAKVTGATKYEIWRKLGSSGTYTKIATVTGTSYTDTGAVKGKTYYYKICAASSYAAATSAYSNEVSSTCQ